MNRLKFVYYWSMTYFFQYIYPNPVRWMDWDDKLVNIRRILRHG